MSSGGPRKTNVVWLGGAACLIAAAATPIAAQKAIPAAVRFDVTSVKTNQSGVLAQRVTTPGPASWRSTSSPRTSSGKHSGGIANVDSPPPESAGASIFTAVRDQLGLRLEPTTAPTDVLVIDRVAEPDPD